MCTGCSKKVYFYDYFLIRRRIIRGMRSTQSPWNSFWNFWVRQVVLQISVRSILYQLTLKVSRLREHLQTPWGTFCLIAYFRLLQGWSHRRFPIPFQASHLHLEVVRLCCLFFCIKHTNLVLLSYLRNKYYKISKQLIL